MEKFQSTMAMEGSSQSPNEKASIVECFGDTMGWEMATSSISEAEVGLKNVSGETSCQPASQQAFTCLDSSFDLSTDGKWECSCEASILHVLERIELHEADVEDNQHIDELPPPRIDKCLVPLNILDKAKLQPSNSHECIPRIGAMNVSSSVFQQRLHGDVPWYWGHSILSDSDHQSFMPQFSSRNHDTNVSEVSIGIHGLSSLLQKIHFEERKDADSSDLTRRPGETLIHYIKV